MTSKKTASLTETRGAAVSTLANEYQCRSCKKFIEKFASVCPICGGWQTLEIIRKKTESRIRHSRTLKEIKEDNEQQFKLDRIRSGLVEVDDLLGGGFVLGSVTLLAGEPGVGKSTLAMQLAASISAAHTCLYLSGEETLAQVALRADRMKVDKGHDRLRFLNDAELDVAILEAQQTNVDFLIVDSIQTVTIDEDTPGSMNQIRECTAYLIEHAKKTGCIVIVIGHITKDDNVAGPKALEHMVDTVLLFQSEASKGSVESPLRTLYVKKHRFGPAQVSERFKMTKNGLN